MAYYCFPSVQPAELLDITNPDWAPSQKLGHESISEDDITLAIARNEREKKRKLVGELVKKHSSKIRAGPSSEASGVEDANVSNEISAVSETASKLCLIPINIKIK